MIRKKLPGSNTFKIPTKNQADKFIKVLYRTVAANNLLLGFAHALENAPLDDSFSDAIDIFKDCQKNKGKIITTGMGKAGIAMCKFSSILCSLGIPSCYLHPGEASHGDLGIISENDVLFVASTSGKTREVLEIIELARGLNISKIVGITSHTDSPIREKADVVIDMGIIKEDGHLNLAPTTSILVMLALTDALAIVIAQENNFTAEDYLKRHHSGYLSVKAAEMAKETKGKSNE